jgi:hypothetical protein
MAFLFWMHMKINLLLVFIAAILAGCGSIQRQQEANHFAQFTGPEAGSVVAVYPVGSIQAQSSSQKGGAAFGLIGALIESAATSDSSQNKGEQITATLIQEKMDEYLAKQVLASINNCNIKGNVSSNPPIKVDKDWLQSTTSVVPDQKVLKVNYVVEVGAPTFVIYDGLVSTKMCGAATAKVFRVSDGVLINKVRGSNQSGLLCNQSLSHYSDADKEKFDELKKTTKDALGEIATKIGQQICRQKDN